MIRQQIGQRLLDTRTAFGISRADVASCVGIGTTTLQQWESGAREASIETIHKLAQLYNVSPQHLIFGDTDAQPAPVSPATQPPPPEHNDYAYIPFYDIQASAGHGLFTEGATQPSKHLAFRRRWLTAKGVQADKLVALLTKGDSMQPTIQDGAVVIVDTTKTTPIDGKLYIIRVGDNLLLKRTQWLINGDLSLISDNKHYAPQTVSTTDMHEHNIQICGQLIHTSHDL